MTPIPGCSWLRSRLQRSTPFRRWPWATALALGLALQGLVSCQSAPPRSRELQLWTLELSPRFDGYMQAAIDEWERQHPGVTVVWTDLPWGSVERKLLAAVYARTAPDLVNLNPLFGANLASKGGLLPLDPLLPAGSADTYLPRVWQAGQVGGQQVAIPWYLTARISLANGDLLQRAGYARPPSRWEEVPAFAEAVKRRTGRYALFVTVVPDDSAELLESMVQMGVVLVDDRRRAAFNTPAGRRAFAFWTDLYRRGLLPREVVSQGYRRAVELYQGGDLALLSTGPEFLRAIQTNAPRIAARTSPHPPITGPGGQTNVAVMNLSIPRQSRMAPEALSLALFLTNPVNQERFAEQARVLPSARGALVAMQRHLEQERPQGAQERLVREARLLSTRSLADAQVLVPASPGVKRLQAILYTQLQRAMLGQVSSDEALATAADDWNRYAAARWP